MSTPSLRISKGLSPVLVAFALVGGILMLTNGLALYQSWRIQRRIGGAVADAMASVELTERMGADVYRQRLLVDLHVFETEAAEMARVEAQIAAVDADYASVAQAYAPYAMFPDEANAWQQLQTDVAATRAPVARALALSGQNLDVEARAALLDTASLFSAVENDVARLVEINRKAADTTVAKMDALQGLLLAISAVLAAVGVALTALIGIRTTRLMRQREEETSQHAAQLEAKNRELDAFAGRVAHDLRGPVSTIKLTAEVIAQRTAGEDRAVARLNRAVGLMEAVIDDLLELARIDAGAPGASCDPAEVVARIGADLSPRLASEQVALRIAVEPSRVKCSEGLLGQALMNLADNAIKYRRTTAAADLEVDGRLDGARYVIRVRDNGVGMSEDEARKAFDPFYRACRVQGAPGTGLGLSIVKRVVEVSGGRISVESKLEQGTTFLIDLPAMACPPRT
jgi:signal transduction histidine kinase